jgi:drug/metabolite transporter, DME family
VPFGINLSSANRSKLVLLFAALLWSTSGLYLRAPLFQALPEESRGYFLACYRSLFAGVFFLLFVNWKQVYWDWRLVVYVVCFVTMNTCYVLSVTMTSAAAAIFLQYTCTAWATVLGATFLRQPADRGQWVAVACSVAGIAWIVSHSTVGASLIGNSLALLAGFALGIMFLAMRALTHHDSMWLVAIANLASMLAVLPVTSAQPAQPSILQIAVIGAAGICMLAFPYWLLARSMRHVSPQEASLILLLEPVLNPIWVWLCWGEAIESHILVGGILIVGGLALRYLVFTPTAIKTT